jgi:hypothetical protein
MASLVVGGLATVVGIVIAFRSTQPVPVWPLAIVVPLWFIAVLSGVRGSLRRQRLAWQSFELSLSSEGIRRSMSGYPDVEIRRDEISAIKERRSGLVVRSHRGGPGLIIPKGLAGFDEVRQDLMSRHGIEKQRGDAHGLVWSLLAVVATLSAFVVVFLSTNPLVVVPLAVIMLVGAGWAIWVVRRSAYVDERTKQTIWFVLMPALAAVFRALSTLGVE